METKNKERKAGMRKKVKWKTKHIACGWKWKRKEIDLGKWKCTHKGSIAFDVSLVTAFMQHLRNFSLGFMIFWAERGQNSSSCRLMTSFLIFHMQNLFGFSTPNNHTTIIITTTTTTTKCSRTAIAFFSSSAFIVYFWTLFCAVLGSIKSCGMRRM